MEDLGKTRIQVNQKRPEGLCLEVAAAEDGKGLHP
jgi:hypothetical protein